MAAIGPSSFFSRFTLALLLLSNTAVFTLRATDQEVQVRTALNDVATALTGSNPADAMVPFSKSYAHYDQLRNCFTGLTNAFAIVNEVDVLEEADTAHDSTATIHWSLTLSAGPVSGNSTQRGSDIHVRLVREKSKWKIIEFSPIDIFDPSTVQQSPKLP